MIITRCMDIPLIYVFFTLCSRIRQECCIESKSPDDELFKHLAHAYADNHPTMHEGNACPPERFPGGVTNGAYW